MTTDLTTDSRVGRRVRIAVAFACGLLALAGCTSSVDVAEMTGEVPDDFRRNHPIAVEESLEIMDIPVGLSMAELPAAMRANIAGFAQKFATSGSAVIAVVAPSGSPNELQAAGIAVQIEDAIRGAGVHPRKVEYRVYRAGRHETNAPVRIAFNRIVAHAAPCAPWPDQVTETGENRNFHAFGCATQQNLAAMVASPLDLIYPRGLTPADASRRANVLEKYRSGEPFTSDTTKETGGSVAQGVGQ